MITYIVYSSLLLCYCYCYCLQDEEEEIVLEVDVLRKVGNYLLMKLIIDNLACMRVRALIRIVKDVVHFLVILPFINLSIVCMLMIASCNNVRIHVQLKPFTFTHFSSTHLVTIVNEYS